MKKLKIFMPLLVVILFSFNVFLQAMPSGCSDIEVSTSGGAPSDPKKKYVFKVEDLINFTDMNEYVIQVTLGLIASNSYFPSTEGISGLYQYDFISILVCNGNFFNKFSKNFFTNSDYGMALEFYSYDKPYMVKREFNCCSTNVRITTSCSDSDEYAPNCYSELVQITNGEETLDLFTFKANYP